MPTITVTTTADQGAGSLREAIATAPTNSTIQFAANLANQTIILNTQLEIAIGKNLIIDGGSAPNFTISGAGKSRIFQLNSTSVTPTNLTVKNLTLANGLTSDRGGAINTTHQGKLTVENVTFNNNIANNGGGAIFSAFEGELTVTNSRFNGNQAIAGNDERGAGAIAFWGPGTLKVVNSEFNGNRGINGAAINSLNGKLIVENSKFINNDTKAARVDNGKENPTLRGYGGAIYTDRANNSITIKNSQFDGNSSLAAGGAIHLFADPDDMVAVESSSFTNNQALGLPGGEGGNGGAFTHVRNALNPNGSLSIKGSTFANNTAYSQGGGLWMNQTRTAIANSTFSGNKVIGNGTSNVGGGMVLYAPTEIVNTTIANNFAGWSGGGVSAINDADVTIRNTIFFNNTADNGTNKWGIQQHSSKELIDGGGNIQFPAKRTNNFNDFNVTKTVRIVDPLLAPLQDNGGGLLTHALLPGSPAINAGTAANAPQVDQRGFLRDGQIDIGAFEVGANRLAGTTGDDVLTGGNSNDALVAAEGNDQLIGGLGADILTGGTGSDRFIYSGSSQRLAFLNSRLNAPDRLTDFKPQEGDRIQLDYDNNLATSQRPKKLYNIGKIKAKTLSTALKTAYGDKRSRTPGKQPLAGNEAVFFRWGNRSYLSVNDNNRAFSGGKDLVVEVTGTSVPNGSVLPVNRYFI
jgi:hypothetical protein